MVDGIRYRKLGYQHVYAQELFKQEELTGFETKGSLFTDDLRNKERARKDRLRRGAFHPLAVGENPAKYIVARSVDDVLVEAAKA